MATSHDARDCAICDYALRLDRLDFVDGQRPLVSRRLLVSASSWFAESWQRVVMLAAIVAALLFAGLRWLGFSLRHSGERSLTRTREQLASANSA